MVLAILPHDLGGHPLPDLAFAARVHEQHELGVRVDIWQRSLNHMSATG
jgi:hypothetical protein